MAYRDDIAALGADHHWDFDGDSLDQIGSVNGTDTSILYTASAIAEDATNCASTNASTDRISIPTTTNINNSAQTRKAVAGWFQTTAIQTPPRRIYGEGDNTTAFQFVLAYGNTSMFEVMEPTSFNVQVIGPVFALNRSYHLCGIFEGNGFDNIVRFYVDGVEQTLAVPTDRQPDTADLNTRGVAEFGDPAGTAGIGEQIVALTAPVTGKWNHWATWDGVSVDNLTDTAIKEELFEKGASPQDIFTGTIAAIQSSIDGYAAGSLSNKALFFRIAEPTEDTDFTITADDITMDDLTSLHVQYTGDNVLTLVNINGSNFLQSKMSTTGAGSIVVATRQTLTVTVLDAVTNAAVSGARVYIEADTGGDLTAGDEIMNTTTNGSGVATVSFDYVADQPVVGRVRKGSASTYYKTAVLPSTLTSSALDTTVLMVEDE